MGNLHLAFRDKASIQALKLPVLMAISSPTGHMVFRVRNLNPVTASSNINKQQLEAVIPPPLFESSS